MKTNISSCLINSDSELILSKFTTQNNNYYELEYHFKGIKSIIWRENIKQLNLGPDAKTIPTSIKKVLGAVNINNEINTLLLCDNQLDNSIYWIRTDAKANPIVTTINKIHHHPKHANYILELVEGRPSLKIQWENFNDEVIMKTDFLQSPKIGEFVLNETTIASPQTTTQKFFSNESEPIITYSSNKILINSQKSSESENLLSIEKGDYSQTLLYVLSFLFFNINCNILICQTFKTFKTETLKKPGKGLF